MHDDQATDNDSAIDYCFVDVDILDNILSTTICQRRSVDGFSTTICRGRPLDVFSRTRSLNSVLDGDGEVLDHDNRVRISPAVNNGLTARGVIKVRMAGVEIGGSFQSSNLLF